MSPRKIEKTDLVFRVMMFDHVPMDDQRKKNPKTTADHHSKVNFPPFQHYRFDKKDKLVCVGKSHWVGGMSNGHFSVDHGKMTNQLAMMYMKLCERYGTRANWRGYTYNDEMQSQALMQLSQIGLQFDESKSDNPFAYYTAAIRVREEAKMPDVGVSVDRRTFAHLSDVYNDKKIESLVCFVCAQVHTRWPVGDPGIVMETGMWVQRLPAPSRDLNMSLSRSSTI